MFRLVETLLCMHNGLLEIMQCIHAGLMEKQLCLHTGHVEKLLCIHPGLVNILKRFGRQCLISGERQATLDPCCVADGTVLPC